MNYYKTIFSLVNHYKYSLLDLESLMPFERDVYVDLLTEFLSQQENETNEASNKAYEMMAAEKLASRKKA